MTETSACVRGCNLYRQHLTDCEDPATCRGCLPRRATSGHLCWPCHRRLELMLHDAATVDRWLTANMASGQGAASEGEHVTGSRELPLPIKAAVYDQRQILRDFYATTLDELIERENLTGPVETSVEAQAKFLLTWLGRIEYWPHVGDLWEYFAGEMSVAHALAPWRPAMRRITHVACPGCAEVNLGIFGGEEDVSCLSCGILMTSNMFGLWERVLKMDVAS